MAEKKLFEHPSNSNYSKILPALSSLVCPVTLTGLRYDISSSSLIQLHNASVDALVKSKNNLNFKAFPPRGCGWKLYSVKTPLCTKEVVLFTPKEMQDICLLQSIIVGVKNNFLLIQIVANSLNNITLWILTS